MTQPVPLTMDEVAERAECQLEALEGVQAALTELTVTETGDDGRVIVTVDVTGAMIDLTILPGAGNGRPTVLAEAVVSTAVRAATTVFTKRADLMTAFIDDFAVLTGTGTPGVSMEPNGDSVRPTLQERQHERRAGDEHEH